MARRRQGLVVGRVRARLLALSLVVALGIVAATTHQHTPLQHWLLWRYLVAWVAALGFAAAAMGVGGHLVDRLLVVRPPWHERWLYELALGVLALFGAIMILGLAGLISAPTMVALVGLGIAAGVPRWRVHGPRLWRRVAARRARPRPADSRWRWVAWAYGAVALGFVYYAMLPAQNAAFDARFYHLAIAQQYVVEGAIRPSVEAWWPAALPHLASVLYTYAFALPGLDMFGRMIAAAHLELVLFLATLGGVGVLVRRLLGETVRGAWVALFLFPGIFLYDAALSTAADHICAFFAIPIYLALMRLWRRSSWREGVLLGALTAGAVLTKYQGIYLVAGPAVALVVRLGWRALMRAPVRPTLEAVGAALATGVICTAPHWAKNWAFYGNPLFPNLLGRFSLEGYPAGTAETYAVWHRWQTADWASGDALDAAASLVTFSFLPHDWEPFHGQVPVFGFLFTLSLLVLPWLKGTRRTWGLVAATHLGLLVWFVTFHQDRYLQILLPWMAVVVAVMIALCWRQATEVKVAVALLVGLQVIWGGDVHSWAAHQMNHEAAAVTTTKLLAAGHAGEYRERLEVPGPMFELGRFDGLPKDATVLVHEQHLRLGIWRPVVSDLAGWQFRLRYEQEPSTASLHRRLSGMGVTHVYSYPGAALGIDGLGADLRFHDFVHHDLSTVSSHGGFNLYELGEAPAEVSRDKVAYLGCAGFYARGLHRLATMTIRDGQGERVKTPRPAEAPFTDEVSLLEQADFAVTGGEPCPTHYYRTRQFVEIAKRRGETLWSRRRDRRDHVEHADH